MTAELNLQFSYLGGSEVGELSALVDVVNDSLDLVVEPQSVALSDGWKRSIAPGTYLARVRFPSGEVIRRTCTVPEGQTTSVSIDVHSLSGQESLERSAVLRPFVRDEQAPGFAGTELRSAWARRWEGGADRRWQHIDFDGVVLSRDLHTVRYQFQVGPQGSLIQFGGPGLKWRFVTLPPRSRVDVVLSPSSEGDLIAEVTTRSVAAESLLGYLRTGAVEGADVVAESLLQQKLEDPIAAAIGGYYLLRTARLERLFDWGENLSAWFPWLADGAVINAWQHIQAGRKLRGDPELHFFVARRELLESTKRGFPVYTEGLKLLLDGLRLLRDDTGGLDSELDSALALIEPLASASEPAAATVTYTGVGPAEPQAKSRYGLPGNKHGVVILHDVYLRDLIELGWLSPDAVLVSAERANKATAILTREGLLDVVGVGTFESPEATGESVLGLTYPRSYADWAWSEWEVARPRDAGPRARAEVSLGGSPSLAQLRWAARGGR